MNYHWWSKYEGKPANADRGRRPKGRGPGPGWVPVTSLEVKDGFWRNYKWYVTLSLLGAASSIAFAIMVPEVLVAPLFAVVLGMSALTGLSLPVFWYWRYRRMAAALDDDGELSDFETEQQGTTGFFRLHRAGLVGSAVVGALAWTTLIAIFGSVTRIEELLIMGTALIPLKWWLAHRRSERIVNRVDEPIIGEPVEFDFATERKAEEVVEEQGARAWHPRSGME